MTGIELMVALRQLGLRQKLLAKEIGIQPARVSRMINDKVPIPSSLSVYIEERLAQLSQKDGGNAETDVPSVPA
jgi:plasmid maintenance system antidote protein VapI